MIYDEKYLSTIYQTATITPVQVLDQKKYAAKHYFYVVQRDGLRDYDGNTYTEIKIYDGGESLNLLFKECYYEGCSLPSLDDLCHTPGFVYRRVYVQDISPRLVPAH